MKTNENEKRWIVYRHVFPNKKCYIGITCQEPNKRWSNGYGYFGKREDGSYKQSLMAHAVQKYGWNSIHHEILFENLTSQEAKRFEQICIILFRTRNDKFGYNLTDGGDGSSGRPISEETKKKIGDKAKERLSIPENNPRYGITLTDETKRKISDALKGKYAGEKAPMYGKHHSEETKEKLRQARLGTEMSEEARAKMSVSHLGKNSGKDNSRSIPVICIDLNIYFDSAEDAGKYTGMSGSTVRDICHQKILQAKGHYFIFAKDFSINNIRKLLMKKRKESNVSVVCIETNQIFNTIEEAHQSTGTNAYNIGQCVLGKRKTTGGYHWRRATEEEWLENRSQWADNIILNLLSNQETMNKINEYLSINTK